MKRREYFETQEETQPVPKKFKSNAYFPPLDRGNEEAFFKVLFMDEIWTEFRKYMFLNPLNGTKMMTKNFYDYDDGTAAVEHGYMTLFAEKRISFLGPYNAYHVDKCVSFGADLLYFDPKRAKRCSLATDIVFDLRVDFDTITAAAETGAVELFRLIRYCPQAYERYKREANRFHPYVTSIAQTRGHSALVQFYYDEMIGDDPLFKWSVLSVPWALPNPRSNASPLLMSVENGHLGILKWCYAKSPQTFAYGESDRYAESLHYFFQGPLERLNLGIYGTIIIKGHLHIVKWLHKEVMKGADIHEKIQYLDRIEEVISNMGTNMYGANCVLSKFTMWVEKQRRRIMYG